MLMFRFASEIFWVTAVAWYSTNNKWYCKIFHVNGKCDNAPNWDTLKRKASLCSDSNRQVSHCSPNENYMPIMIKKI